MNLFERNRAASWLVLVFAIAFQLQYIQATNNEKDTISIIDNFLTPTEASTLLNSYSHLLKHSMHVDGEEQSTETATRGKYRTSKSIRLPPLGDPLILELERRAIEFAGSDTYSHIEDFQLACYDVEDLYGLHRDDSPSGTAKRAATVLIYLHAPEEGGETLFTHRPLEEERDLDTGERLSTQDGALKLFRHYCDDPPESFTSVSPEVGKAVIWKNWVEGEGFATNSTHGACPVKKGKKCVIQQWISRSEVHPLRDDDLAALFPLGVAEKYRKFEDVGVLRDSATFCFPDASHNEGQTIPGLCTSFQSHLFLTEPKVRPMDDTDGPFPNLAAVRLINTALSTPFPPHLFRSGFTLSFWAASLQKDSRLVHIVDTDDADDVLLSAQLRKVSTLGDFSIRLSSSKTSSEATLDFMHWDWFGKESKSTTDWFYFVLTFDPKQNSFTLTAHSRKKITLGKTTLTLPHFQMEDVELKVLQPPTLPPTPKNTCAEEEKKTFFSDIAFLTLHSKVIGEARDQLRFCDQARRYDINT